jgi:hypothetical protein
MSDLVLDAPPQNPRGIRAIVPDGDPGHFKGMKVFCHRGGWLRLAVAAMIHVIVSPGKVSTIPG